MFIPLLAFHLFSQLDEIELARSFTKGQIMVYDVKSNLQSEIKEGEMSYFLPVEVDINFQSTSRVQDVKDGFASILYERPEMVIIDGETADSPPKTHVEKIGVKALLTLSPINEVTDVKDLSDKKGVKKSGLSLLAIHRDYSNNSKQDFISSLVGNLQQMALFIGNLDISLDLSPKLPVEPVKPGDTWKKTVSYQPQSLKGTDKQAIQRLDFVYKYEGLKEVDGRKVHQVSASLDLDTDAALFLNQVLGMKPEESNLKEVRMVYKSRLVFDLDEKTKMTLSATGESAGKFDIILNSDPNNPIHQQKFKARNKLKLVSLK